MGFLKKPIKAINRRNEKRYILPNLAVYTEEGSDFREKLLNVSLSGCCLSSPINIKREEHLLVHFITSSHYNSAIDDSFCLDGQVVWKSTENEGTGYRYGLRFMPPRSEFFIRENQAFREQIARLACAQYTNKAS